ncbi:unnamed protein product, partial [Scytosiphon promiscuus]
MGKYRGHQDKSRRGREKKLLKKKRAAVTGSSTHAGENGATEVDKKRKLKHVTYGKEHSVLIVGDGDFSFCRGVIRHRGTGAGVVATSLDSQKAVLKKYPRANTWLPKLNADGAQVVHSVDATRLEETLLGSDGGEEEEAVGSGEGAAAAGEKKKRVLFDRVVFNFPHTGKQRIHLNRNLIRDFFASTKGLVKCAAAGGEIHVTLKDKPPYSGWNVKGMAKESGLVMVRCLAFDPSVFPGYRHSTTDPQAKEFDAAGARTSVFCRARSALDDNVDESGAFPVIAQRGPALSSESDGHRATADNNGSGRGGSQAGKEEDDGDSESEDSDGGDLLGNGGGAAVDAAGGGGLEEWDAVSGGDWEEENGADKGDATAVGAGGGGGDGGTGKKDGKKRKKKRGQGGDGGATGAAEAGKDGSGDGAKKGAKEGGTLERGMLRPPVEKKKAAAAKEAAAAAAAAATAGAAPATDDG